MSMGFDENKHWESFTMAASTDFHQAADRWKILDKMRESIFDNGVHPSSASTVIEARGVPTPRADTLCCLICHPSALPYKA